jgi:hypothetical protein
MVRDGSYRLRCLIAGAESRSITVPNHTNELASVVEHYQLHTVFETSYSVPHTVPYYLAPRSRWHLPVACKRSQSYNLSSQ